MRIQNLHDLRGLRLIAGLGIFAVTLFGCGENEEILPGERLDLRADLSVPLDPTEEGATPVEPEPVNRAAPISFPAASSNASWPQSGGNAAHAITNRTLSATPQQIWAVPIGEGNSKRARITAEPVVVGNQIYTLDARATVTAISTSGQILWTRNLVPEGENEKSASGGGLAVDGNRLFVSTAFGQLHALDRATGNSFWVQQLDISTTGPPAVSGNIVTVLTRDNIAWAIDTRNGRVIWQRPGVRSASGVVGGTSPAISDNSVVLPYSSGEIATVSLSTGEPLWASTIAGARVGPTFSRVLDISGDPVITGGRVYIGNSAGRVAAMNLSDGGRIWTSEEGALNTPLVAGGSVFQISDKNELLRLDAGTGERIWGIELPFFRDVRRLRRLKDVYVHFGPVLASGRLLVASDDGLLRSFSPTDGRLLSAISLAEPAAVTPVIAGQVLYVVTQDGTLRALR